MTRSYLTPTPELIAEYRTHDYPSLEADIRCLSLPAGDPDATRLMRHSRSGKLRLTAPWLLSDTFDPEFESTTRTF